MCLYADLNRAPPGWAWSITCKLSARSITTLKNFWNNLGQQEIGRRWGPLPRTSICEFTISTDASKTAWGATLHGSQNFTGDKSAQFARAAWPEATR